MTLPEPNNSEQDEDKPTSSSAGRRSSGGDAQGDEAAGSSSGGGPGRFDCNICLDAAKDAVVSMCGHLFCWPCIHQWLETRPHRQLCPVCKSAISRDKVIPLYGRGGNETDPREKVPPRPAGQRTEAPQYNGFPGFHWGGGDGAGGGGVQFSFGIGTFPITMFASAFNLGIGDRRPAAPTPGSRQHDEEQMLSNIFMWIGIAFIFFLLFA